MANTRGKTKELETPVVRPTAEVNTNMNASKISTLKFSLQSLLRKLAYYDKSTAKILNENQKRTIATAAEINKGKVRHVFRFDSGDSGVVYRPRRG